MTDLFQFARADGKPITWSPGRDFFGPVWEHVEDHLRFHRGEGFTVQERGTGENGTKHKLSEVGERTRKLLERTKNDTVFEISSVEDGFSMLMRRRKGPNDKGQLVVAQAAGREGTPYLFGATDCSWLSQTCVNEVTGILLPHNAAMQRADGRVLDVTKNNLKPGDLVFIDDLHHVAIFLDWKFGGRVWDTEPHTTTVPGNWMPDADGQLGVGVRIRPMFLPWYCGRIDSFGRIEAVNGKP